MLRVLLIVLLCTGSGAVQAAIAIVAAENMYGDVAAQLAGSDATVTSILANPDQDPHLFEASPAVARALSTATIVICNGMDYDPWMTKLLAASAAPARQVIEIGALLQKHSGDNPHLWYDPAAMRALAAALTGSLVQDDPAHADAFTERQRVFLGALDGLDGTVAAFRMRHAGASVTATEPVFGPMAAILGLTMRNERFQRAIMNDTEPRVSDMAAFEDDLTLHRVRALIYNSQATGPAAQRLLGVARRAGVPVVAVTETEPAGTPYQAWMAAEIGALDRALSPP